MNSQHRHQLSPHLDIKIMTLYPCRHLFIVPLKQETSTRMTPHRHSVFSVSMPLHLTTHWIYECESVSFCSALSFLQTSTRCSLVFCKILFCCFVMLFGSFTEFRLNMIPAAQKCKGCNGSLLTLKKLLLIISFLFV